MVKKLGRILLSNDDGINAPGLKSLLRIAKELSDDIVVVAPESEQSGASHSLTLTRPLRVRRIAKDRFAVDGTPTDCVLMAVQELCRDRVPDLLLSGVNRGANAGEDVTYSGTIAAAMEGTLMGVPSIALSQSVAIGQKTPWKTAEHWAPDLIRRVVTAGWPEGVLININFPECNHNAVKGVRVVPQGRRALSDVLIDARVDTRSRPYYWIGFRHDNRPVAHNTDLACLEDDEITVTPLQLDLTDRKWLKNLRAALS